MSGETYRRGGGVMQVRGLVRGLLLVLGLAATPTGPVAAEVTVFAASSLKTALDRIAAAWQAETGQVAVMSYDGSAKLAKQIVQGAPAQIFISAAPEWMDVVQSEALIDDASRRDILGNHLVLIGHGAGLEAVEIGRGLDLPGLLAGGKLAMGMVDAVPAGQYGKEALDSLGLWQAVAAEVVQVDNARAALALVAAGEARLGIVFASDASAGLAAGDDIGVLGVFPAESHRPIRYPAAVLRGAGPEAAAFFAFLTGPAASEIFRAEGFVLPQTDG
jgi:molybdate transport system substrate-binding protein